MEQHTYQNNEVIFAEGDPSSTMFEVVSGTVGIYAAWGTDDQKQLATLNAGKVFGEMGLVEYYPRSATAIALADNTRVNEVSPSELVDYLEGQPDKVLAIMRQLSSRLRDTNDRYEEAQRAVHDAIEAERGGKRRGGGLRKRLTRMILGVKDWD